MSVSSCLASTSVRYHGQHNTNVSYFFHYSNQNPLTPRHNFRSESLLITLLTIFRPHLLKRRRLPVDVLPAGSDVRGESVAGKRIPHTGHAPGNDGFPPRTHHVTWHRIRTWRCHWAKPGRSLTCFLWWTDAAFDDTVAKSVSFLSFTATLLGLVSTISPIWLTVINFWLIASFSYLGGLTLFYSIVFMLWHYWPQKILLH